MAESAALLVDGVLPHEPTRQWVLSFPFQLRFLLASRPAITDQVLGIVYRVISTHLVKKAGYSKKTARTGAVTLIQRFGRSGAPAALNLNIDFTCCSWLRCMSTASMDQFYFTGSVHQLPRS